MSLEIKFTPAFLTRLEAIFNEADYYLRYEKGNFKSGYCVLKEKRIIIVNKYFTLEGKINCLIEILRQAPLELNGLTEKTRELAHLVRGQTV